MLDAANAERRVGFAIRNLSRAPRDSSHHYRIEKGQLK